MEKNFTHIEDRYLAKIKRLMDIYDVPVGRDVPLTFTDKYDLMECIFYLLANCSIEQFRQTYVEFQASNPLINKTGKKTQ